MSEIHIQSLLAFLTLMQQNLFTFFFYLLTIRQIDLIEWLDVTLESIYFDLLICTWASWPIFRESEATFGYPSQLTTFKSGCSVSWRRSEDSNPDSRGGGLGAKQIKNTVNTCMKSDRHPALTQGIKECKAGRAKAGLQSLANKAIKTVWGKEKMLAGKCAGFDS